MSRLTPITTLLFLHDDTDTHQRAEQRKRMEAEHEERLAERPTISLGYVNTDNRFGYSYFGISKEQGYPTIWHHQPTSEDEDGLLYGQVVPLSPFERSLYRAENSEEISKTISPAAYKSATMMIAKLCSASPTLYNVSTNSCATNSVLVLESAGFYPSVHLGGRSHKFPKDLYIWFKHQHNR